MMATQLLVVPRSMPITLAIACLFLSKSAVRRRIGLMYFYAKDNQYSVVFNVAAARRAAGGGRQPRDRDPGRAQQPVPDVIAAHEFIDHRVGLMPGAFHLIDRFVQQGIEGLANRAE